MKKPDSNSDDKMFGIQFRTKEDGLVFFLSQDATRRTFRRLLALLAALTACGAGLIKWFHLLGN